MAVRFRFLCAPLVPLLFAASAIADLPVISLSSVMPPGGKCGTEFEVTIAGGELTEANALHFSHPGISAKFKSDKQFVVTIAPEVPVGNYDVRISGKSGISNPRAFVAGEWTESVEKAANDKPDAAVELVQGATFNGTVAAATSDYFKFNAKQNQRVLLQCAAPEIDSRLSPVIAVRDASGRELASSRRSGFLDFTAPADGVFLVELHDLTFGGGSDFFYRLTLSDNPRIEFIVPPVGQAGTKGKFTLFGRGLPGGIPAGFNSGAGEPLEKLEVEIEIPTAPMARSEGWIKAASSPLDTFSYRCKTPAGTSNPVFISLANTPVNIEQEPNNKPAEAKKLAVPCEVAGQFFPGGDVDAFTFDGKKGDVFWIEIVSHRLGLPTNPFLLVQREGADAQEVYGTETNVGGPRFNTITNDPAVRLEVKEDGAYRVQVRDLFGATRSDPRNVYQLSIRRESPDFRLAAIIELPPKKEDDRAAVARAAVLHGGETTPVRVVAFRRDGFAGEIDLSCADLPPGVSCASAKIPAGKNDTLLLLTAGDPPVAWAGPIRIAGKAKIGDAEVAREARAAAVTWNVPDFNNELVFTRLTQDLALAVCGTESAPISVAAAEEKVWEIAAGGKLDIPLTIARRGGFEEALKLKAFDAPAIEGMKEIDVDGKATTATASIDLATVKIPAGNHTIHFRAHTKGKFREKETVITVFSTPIRISVK